MIPLGGESIVERVLRSLRGAGLEQVAISLGYLGHLVEAVIGDGSRHGVEVRYTRETEPLGTAGALGLIPFDVADDDLVLVVNGDTLTSLDMGELLSWFEGVGADAAMVCVEREVKIDYGVVIADEAGDLVEIHEKPSTLNLLSTGINVISGRALRAHTPTSFAWIEKISQKSSPCSGTLHVARRAVSTRSMLTSQGRRGRRAVDIRSGHRRRRPGRATVVTAARCGLRP